MPIKEMLTDAIYSTPLSEVEAQVLGLDLDLDLRASTRGVAWRG